MALVGLLCLSGVVLACKVREGNRAAAQGEAAAPKVQGEAPPKPAEAPKKDEKAALVPLTERARELPPPGAPLPELKPSPETKPEPPAPLRLTGTPAPDAGSEPRPILIPTAATAPAPTPPAPPASPAPPPALVPPPEPSPPAPPAPPPVRSAEPPLAAAAGPMKNSAAEGEPLKPLPAVRTKVPAAKPKALLPLTGTFVVTLDAGKGCALPKALLEQLGDCDTVMVSPGTDKCLWLTNHAHLERLCQRLDQSPAREADVRTFKRLYYAQAVKTAVKADGQVMIADCLAAFAGLGREIVLVGHDDHFEVWDAARWRRYIQEKARAAVLDRD
jgi:division/cell wall cluster transcriptional repressor MraZ